MTKYLVVGLGNPGAKYQHTRHNIGFDVVTAFVARHGGAFRTDRYAEVANLKIRGRMFICILPTTYMNLSGKAFKYWLDYEKVSLENSITVVDDIALPLNRIRLRSSGSDAGHNGLKDIQAMLGTTQYPKLRFGIGDKYPKGMQAEFVLSKWLPEEAPIVKQKIDKCVDVIESFAFSGIERTMNEVNKLDFSL
ncbi:MAG TPA: aminoacyl-tRNA hydrolase [Chitinophagaceae bacterium]